MTTQKWNHANSIQHAGLIALVLAGACVGEVETETASSEVEFVYEDAIAWAERNASGEITAELVAHDETRNLLALLRVADGKGSWEDEAGNVRELVLGPAAAEGTTVINDPPGADEGVTLIGQFPTTPEEGAVTLYAIWRLHVADVGYSGCYTTQPRCRPDNCCEYSRWCPIPCGPNDPPGSTCYSVDLLLECYGGGGDDGGHGCGNYI